MAKIYVLKTHPLWAYDIGNTGEVPDKVAEPMIKSGYWKQLDEPKQSNNSKRTSSKSSKPRRSKDVSAD